MDEHDGQLRVATTNEYYSPRDGNVRYNAVHVLDEDLNTVGSLDRIAQNESMSFLPALWASDFTL